MNAKKPTSTNIARKPLPKDFVNQLAEIHNAEKELTLALPLVAKAAHSKDLKTLLQFHLKETKEHAKNIDAIADSLDEKLPHKISKGMTTLIKDTVKVMAKNLGAPELDSKLIAAGRKIEQFEIVAYENLCARAEAMNYTHELALLTSTLNQEKLADELLAGLATKTAPLKKLVEKTSLKKAGATSGI